METPKTIHFTAKCSDCCFTEVKDEKGNVLAEHDGYVPDFMPDEGGDYVTLDIDIATGRILNWRKDVAEQIETFIEDNS